MILYYDTIFALLVFQKEGKNIISTENSSKRPTIIKTLINNLIPGEKIE